jgi:RES domain-containing protein
LACLEVLVHLRDPELIPQDYVFTRFTIPDGLIQVWGEPKSRTIEIVKSETLSRNCGDNWLAYGKTVAGIRFRGMSFEGSPRFVRSPVQTVPSIIIPQEWNYLLDPDHPRFERIDWADPELFQFDLRLIKRPADM